MVFQFLAGTEVSLCHYRFSMNCGFINPPVQRAPISEKILEIHKYNSSIVIGVRFLTSTVQMPNKDIDTVR